MSIFNGSDDSSAGSGVAGAAVGCAVGDAVGAAVGDAVGSAVGDVVGSAVGDAVGSSLGGADGSAVSDALGSALDDANGSALSVAVGCALGEEGFDVAVGSGSSPSAIASTGVNASISAKVHAIAFCFIVFLSKQCTLSCVQ